MTTKPTTTTSSRAGRRLPMNVRRIGYVGMRTEYLERMTWFFRDVLGLSEAMVGDTFSILRLPTGPFDFAEVYSPDHHDERMILDGVEGPVVAFAVDDLEMALQEVKEAGGGGVWAVGWGARGVAGAPRGGPRWGFLR